MIDRSMLRGNRGEWEFEYTASKLAEGAKAQKAYRESRVTWWSEQKELVMKEIRESGIDISESVADKAGYLSNNTMPSMGPQITVRTDLQRKLNECHSKIEQHRNLVAEYEGWVQVLEGNPEARVKCTQGDWLFFFGKV